jgi:hypothetical protein
MYNLKSRQIGYIPSKPKTSDKVAFAYGIFITAALTASLILLAAISPN